jgi:Na+-transporting NADH:ubiquinone oxidoreductase subunit A
MSQMSKTVKLKKGLNIRLKGAAGNTLAGEIHPALFSVRPSDFPSITPRLYVKPGDQVKAGTPLFHDKVREELRFASPISGTVKAVTRGEKRIILEVVIERNGDDYVQFGKSDPSSLARQQIKEKLLESGIWPVIRQRPYHIIANPSATPKSIFISGFDSAPLAPDLNFVAENTNKADFQKGIDVLKKLTDGNVNLVLDGSSDPADILKNAAGVEIHRFTGPHPAGNVGIQIHHIDPVNKGEAVWYVNLQDVAVIGTLFNQGIYKPDRIIALAGSEVTAPQYYKTRSGASVGEIIKGNIKDGKVRVISGNVLTGTAVGHDGYLGFYDNMISVIPEGDYFEFFGWALPGLNKYSFSKTFLSSLAGKKDYRLDTNLHGGHRAFVLTGQYEQVVPMDIYPMQLLKSILAEDIDNMENLGIYEIAEEDFALCEFICPSKTEIQAIVRKGLDLMVKEMN